MPQKVKNCTTFIPIAAAPVAIIIAANNLSRSPENTTIASLFCLPAPSSWTFFSSSAS